MKNMRMIIFILILFLQIIPCNLVSQSNNQKDNPPSKLNVQEIHQAIIDNDLQKVKAIISENPDAINQLNNKGWLPIFTSCFYSHYEILEYLLSKGASINTESQKYTLLHLAIHSYGNPSQRYKMVEMLLKEKPEMATKQNFYGITPLHWAGTDLKETIDLLLEKGADINANDFNGYTPLHYWTRWWRDALSEYIIGKGADVNAKDNHGQTPLHLAAIVGRIDKAQLLLKHNAKINEIDIHGFTAMDYSIRYGHEKLTDFLKEKGGILEYYGKTNSYTSLKKNNPKEQEAFLWYMDSNGWIVKTKNNLLVFDYLDWGIYPDKPSLDNGRININDLKNKNIFVFVSNRRGFNKNILKWKDQKSDIRYITGYKDERLKEALVLTGNTTETIKNVNIKTLELLGGDIGFLIEVDDIVILFAGEKCSFSAIPKTMSLENNNIDISILPITVQTEQENIESRMKYLAQKLKPKIVLPSSGDGSAKFIYENILKSFESEGLTINIHCALNRGDCFLYSKGNLKSYR